MDNDGQILKSRDDKTPVRISKVADATDKGDSFTLAGESGCSWLKKDEPIGAETLRPRIEPC
jgi:hypothetical protein